MIQFSEDSFRNTKHVLCWYGFAFQAGAINAGGFLACHTFVSHVTGFGTLIGIQIGSGQVLTAVELLAVPFSFLLGAIISALLIDRRQLLHKPPKYITGLGLISGLLGFVLISGCLGWLGEFGEPFKMGRDVILVSALCIACGLQNASIVTATKGQIRTTHLTGILTDFGITLVKARHLKRFSKEKYRQILINRVRMGTLICFSTGSTLSSLIFVNYGYIGFSLPFLTSLTLLTVLHIMKPGRSSNSPFSGNRIDHIEPRSIQSEAVLKQPLEIS